jgi:hypothetical protein
MVRDLSLSISLAETLSEKASFLLSLLTTKRENSFLGGDYCSRERFLFWVTCGTTYSLSRLDFCHNHARNFPRKNLAHRCNKRQGIIHELSLKRSSFLREPLSVSTLENILKK